MRFSLVLVVLLLGTFAGSAHAAPVREAAPGAAVATNLFTTIGITRSETRERSEIYGNPLPYSLPAEEMPPSGTVGPAPSDTADDVPLRMPDTSGTKPNLAAFRGQVLTLRSEDQKPFARLHFFGTTTDGGPAGGDFVLGYSDATTATVQVRFPDWCGSGNASAHFAIGPLSQRYRTTGSDGARCGIYHLPVTNPQPAKTLVSVTLPSTTTPGNPPIQAYLMALTLEEPNGAFERLDLSGEVEFPDDDDAPVTTHTLEPGAPGGDQGWYTGPVRVTLAGRDEEGGSGVQQLLYRIDGGAPQTYAGPFDFTLEGEHTLEYRSIDGAGNAEGYKAVTLKLDATTPTTTTALSPGLPLGEDGWYDGAVTVRLGAADGAGSGVTGTEYRVDGGAWTAYGDPVVIAAAGVHELQYRSVDVAGNEEPARSLTLKVDGTAPVTGAQINGAAPVAEYSGPVRLTLTPTDGEGSGTIATEWGFVDDEVWRPYVDGIEVSDEGSYRIDYRSIDAAGNTETYKWVIFTIKRPPPAAVAPPAPVQAAAAPKPKPSAALEDLASSTVAALRAGRVTVQASCQAVERGTLQLTVTTAVAKRLRLSSRTLAGGSLRCGAEGRGRTTLKPSAKVKRALARTRGSLTATLTLRLSGPAGTARDTQIVTFRGKS